MGILDNLMLWMSPVTGDNVPKQNQRRAEQKRRAYTQNVADVPEQGSLLFLIDSPQFGFSAASSNTSSSEGEIVT
jgi:hypothetical protein